MVSIAVFSLFLVFQLVVLLDSVTGFDTGDRVSATIQTLHNDWKTVAAELPLSQMPYFGKESGSVVVNTPLPLPDPSNVRSMAVNPAKDVKVQLTFGNSVQVPWVTVFDSKKQRSLQTLSLTFYTDRYNIVRVVHSTEYTASTKKLDPNHPSVTGFEVKYTWHGVEDQDTPHGLYVMFLATAAMGMVLVLVINRSTSEEGKDDIPPQARKTSVSKRR